MYLNLVLQNVEEVYTVLLRVQRTKLVMLTEGPAAGDALGPTPFHLVVKNELEHHFTY